MVGSELLAEHGLEVLTCHVSVAHANDAITVSYTHLTLPTILRV